MFTRGYKHSHHLHFGAPCFASFFSKTQTPGGQLLGASLRIPCHVSHGPSNFFTDFGHVMVMKSDDFHGIFPGFFHVFFSDGVLWDFLYDFL